VARDENDIIDDKPMPLLEHLSELRRRLLWSGVASSSPF
jgi:sec-independent protein translocase protein TatC